MPSGISRRASTDAAGMFGMEEFVVLVSRMGAGSRRMRKASES